MFMGITLCEMLIKRSPEMFFISTKLRWINFSCFFFCAAVYSNAQVTQTRRIEIPIQQDFESHNVVTLDTSGIILYRGFVNPTGNHLELTRLDTAMSMVWKGAVPVPKGFTLIKAKAA